MKITVSGLVNVETTVLVRGFPIPYYPIDYPFFGVGSDVSGVGYNLAKALRTLGDEVSLISYTGQDEEAGRILRQLEADEIDCAHIRRTLRATPVSVVLYDESGRRQIYCDLKNIQDRQLPAGELDALLSDSDLIAACNISFNRSLLERAKALGKTLATDVHVIGNLEDEYNRAFLEAADILFCSDEQIPCRPEDFLRQMRARYPMRIAVIGMGAYGAMLYEREGDRIWHLPPARAQRVVNTVGAGDALFSSFLHYYGKGMEALPALERAQIFAARKIAHSGASVGFSREEEVEEQWRGSERTVNPIQ